MSEDMNSETAVATGETAVAATPSVEAAETAELREPLVVRIDRAGREWAEVWMGNKIIRIRTDLVSALTLDRANADFEDGFRETVPNVHLAGGKDVIRVNETSWTALNDHLFGTAR